MFCSASLSSSPAVRLSVLTSRRSMMSRLTKQREYAIELKCSIRFASVIASHPAAMA